jgi:hypothetical protein
VTGALPHTPPPQNWKLYPSILARHRPSVNARR